MYEIEFEYQREEGTNKPVVTQCEVRYSPEGAVLYGQAVLHKLDNPVKEIGRKLALARAITSLSEVERLKVWNVDFARRRAS